MGRLNFPGIVGPSYSTKTRKIDCQVTMNWMPVPINSTNAKTQWALYPVPGYTHLTFTWNGVDYDHLPSSQVGSIRGMYYTSKGLDKDLLGFLVVVAAEAVWRVYPKGVDGKYEITKLGVVSNLVGKVSMVDDGAGLVISDNATIYRYDLKTGQFGSLGSQSPLQATSVTFYNGFTLCAGKVDGQQSNTFFWSDLYHNETWNSLDYASAEGFADPVLVLKKAGNDIWALGPRSYECWAWTGDKNLPFRRMGGSMGNIGTASAASVVEIGDRIAFIGSGAIGTRKAYITNGYGVDVISTEALEEAWTGYEGFEEASAWAYTHEGFTYYVVTWDTANITWCYCLESKQWHQRATRAPGTDLYNKWRVAQGAYAYDKMFVGDQTSTKLYQLDSDVYTEDGTQIVRMRRGPHMTKGQMKVRYNSITVDCEVGMGDPYGQGANPQLMIRYSNDGGETFGTELWKPTGTLGQFRNRLKWMRQGESFDRVYELYASDPVRWVILGCELDVEDKETDA